MPWSIRKVQNTREVHLCFDGHLSAEEGRASLNALLDAMGGQNISVVCDIRCMSGYETAARLVWQRGLWQHRKQIDTCGFIGGNSIVRVGARMMCGVLGIRVYFVEQAESRAA